MITELGNSESTVEGRGADRVVVFSANLMDRGRFRHLGDLTFVNADVELPAATKNAVVVFADLSIPGAIKALRKVVEQRDAENAALNNDSQQQPLKVFAFAGHVETQLIDAAREIPGVEVFSRSIFFRRLANTKLRRT